MQLHGLMAAAAILGIAAHAAAKDPAPPPAPDKLQRVASVMHQVTGIAVSETGRIFVSFPRWTEDAPVSVAELVKGGALRAYPNEEWNRWRNAAPLGPTDHFVCAQSVVADGRGSLWVLDPAAPNAERLVQKGPKLVRVDLSSNQVKQVILFDPAIAPEGSYLNDVRFSPDGRWAYLTDSGASGALVAVDLSTGRARRVLDGDVSTQPDPTVAVVIDGHELRRPDGRGVRFAADSIALDSAGVQLYFKPLTGRTLHRVATAALRDGGGNAAGHVEKAADLEPTDGFWMDRQDRLYITSIQDNAVKVRLPDGRIETVAQDPRLRWPDSMAEGPDGALYVTASRIQDSPWFHSTGWAGGKSFEIFKFVPPGGQLASH